MNRSLQREVLTLLAILGATACGTAQDWEDRRVLLHPGGDVLAAGSTVELSDSVAGDAMTAGGSVQFDGFTGGSYVGAGGEQEVRGLVEGSVRAAAGRVRLAALVGRNVTLAGGSVELREGADVAGNAYVAGGSIQMDGTVRGDLYAGAGEVVLDGVVGGDARVEARRLTLGRNARIAGNLRYRTQDGGFSIDPEAIVGGDIEALPARDDGAGAMTGVAGYVLRLLAFVLCGAIAVAIFPEATGAVADTARQRPAAALGLGFLGIILVPFAVVITAVTVIGIPLAMIFAGLYVASLYLAPIVPAIWVGTELLRGPTPDRSGRLKRFLVGGPIVAVAVLLPWAGLLMRLLATALGLGAVALALLALKNRAPQAA